MASKIDLSFSRLKMSYHVATQRAIRLMYLARSPIKH